jgi:hypothetical protein
MKKNSESSPEIVSEAEEMRAQICACGTVHFSIGPMTLRFSAASFERLFRLVTQIRGRMAARGLLPAESAPEKIETPVACA